MGAPAEVCVVGAGIAGISAALELARRGVKVTVIDRGPVAGGATGLGEGNVLCARAEPGPTLALTRLGRALYDEIEAERGAVARIRRKGALVVHHGEDGLRRGAEHVRRMRAAGVECRLVDAGELRAIEPHLSPALHGAEEFPGDLQCDPRAITVAMAEEVRARGGRIATGVEARALRVRRGRVVGIETAGEPIACGAVVLAAGAWSKALAATAELPLPVQPRKGQLALTEPAPELFEHKLIDGDYASAATSGDPGLAVATVLESTWSGAVVIGSSRERRGFDTTVDPRVTALVVERAARVAPVVAKLSVRRTWAGLRPFLPDHRPAIGPSRAVEGLWVSTGHEGAGVALGPISGRLLAQAFCGEPASIDLAPFAVDRFQDAAATRPAAPPSTRGRPPPSGPR